MANAVKEIHNQNAFRLSYEETYRYAYNLVIAKHGDIVYHGVNKLIAEHLDRLAKEDIAPTFPTGGSGDPAHQSQEGEVFLKAITKVWVDHLRCMRQLKQVLHYMVAFFLRKHYDWTIC